MRIFLSYARSDGASAAQSLYRYLRDAGHTPFLDAAGLASGRSWSKDLENEIAGCDTLIALLSPGAFASDMCRAEQLRALRIGKRVIPVKLAGGSDVIPLHLEARQWTDFDFDKIEAALSTGSSDASLNGSHIETFVTRPSLPPGLVQRTEDLDALREALIRERPNRQVAIVAVRAQGGIGKSVLANMAFDDPAIQAAYPDGLLWLQLGQHVTEAQILERLHEALRVLKPELDLQRYNTLTAASNQFRTALQTRHALIVLDDLWDARHLRHFIFHEAGNATILVTTRDEDVVRSTRAAVINLNKLDERLSADLLRERSGWTGELPSEGRELVDLCDGLPLALAMVGAQLYNAPLKKWQYLVDRLKQADLRAVAIALPDYEKHASLYEAIHVAVDDVQSPDRERYLDIAMFPDDTTIPEVVFRTLWATDPFSTLDTWTRLSLATRDSEDRVGFHDLQIAYARSCQQDMTELHKVLVDQYAERCGRAWHTLPADGYIHSWLPWHLKRAGYTEELRSLLLDTRWLAAKLAAQRDPNALIADCNLLPADERIQSLADALRLSSHVLAPDPSQLVVQLAGRIEVEPRVIENGSRRQLIPLTRNLTSPGEGLLRTVDTQDGPVARAVFCDDGTHVLCGFGLNRLALWNLATGKRVREFDSFTTRVSALAVSRTGTYAVAASTFGELRRIDWSTSSTLRLRGHLHAVDAVAITPDLMHIVSVSAADEEVRVWDLTSGALLESLGGYGSGVRSFALAPAGDRLIVVSGFDLELWSVSPLQRIRVFERLADALQQCVISADGNSSLCSYRTGMLRLLDLRTGVWARDPEANATAIGLAASHIVASSQSALLVWNMQSHRPSVFQGQSAWIDSLCVSSDGTRALTGAADGALKLWNIEVTGSSELRRAEGVTQVLTTEDGRYAMSISADNTAQVWNLEDGRLERSATAPNTVNNYSGRLRLCENGRRVVLVWGDHWYWDIDGGSEVEHVDKAEGEVASSDGAYRIEAVEGRILLYAEDLDTPLGSWTTDIESWGFLAVSPDRRRTLLSDGYRVELRDVASGRLIAADELPRGTFVYALLFFPGSLAAVIANDTVWRIDEDGLSTLSLERALPSPEVLGYDAGLITAVLCDNRSVELQDAKSGERLASFTADHQITCCALTRDARRLICGDASGRVHILKVGASPA